MRSSSNLLSETSPLRMNTNGAWWSSRSTSKTHYYFIRKTSREILSILISNGENEERKIQLMETITKVTHSKSMTCTTCGGKGKGIDILDSILKSNQKVNYTNEKNKNEKNKNNSPNEKISNEKKESRTKRIRSRSSSSSTTFTTKSNLDFESEQKERKKKIPLCLTCHGAGSYPCGLSSVSMNSLLKTIWKQMFETSLKIYLKQYSFLNITNQYDVVKINAHSTSTSSNAEEKQHENNQTGKEEFKEIDNTVNVNVDRTTSVTDQHVICHGWCELHTLDTIDSSGPQGSPIYSSFGKPVPIQSILLILTSSHYILLKQPKRKALFHPGEKGLTDDEWKEILSDPIEIIHYNSIQRICVSSDGFLLHLQHTANDSNTNNNNTITKTEEENFNDNQIFISKTFSFRSKSEGTTLYTESMRHLRRYRHLRVANSGVYGAANITSEDISGGGASAVPIFEHDVSTEIGVRGQITQYHSDSTFHIVLMTPVDYYGDSLSNDHEGNVIGEQSYVQQMTYQGLRWLVCTSHGVICLLEQNISNWVSI